MALYDGKVLDRYTRENLLLLDSRKLRGFDYQNVERRTRRYVDPATVSVAGDGTVSGTVTTTGDNSNGYTVVLSPA